MYGILLFIHILVCVLLIIVVLIQQTRGAGMSSVFGGGGGSDALFGGKGATPFFIKLTSGLAIAFFCTSLVLVLVSRRPVPKSAIDRGLNQEVPVQQPSQPGIPSEPQPSIPTEPSGGK
jgi:preprotein translocase subunit SecG